MGPRQDRSIFLTVFKRTGKATSMSLIAATDAFRSLTLTVTFYESFCLMHRLTRRNSLFWVT